MDHIKLNKWQRLVLLLGSLAFLSRAYVLWEDDDKPGTAFLVGIVLAVLTLTKPREGEEILPFWNRVARDQRTTFRSVALVVGGLAIGAVAIGAATSYRSRSYAADEAAADMVEMPAEEAMPADAATAPVDAMAPASDAMAAAEAASDAKTDAELAADAAERAADEAAAGERARFSPPPSYNSGSRSYGYPSPAYTADRAQTPSEPEPATEAQSDDTEGADH